MFNSGTAILFSAAGIQFNKFLYNFNKQLHEKNVTKSDKKYKYQCSVIQR